MRIKNAAVCAVSLARVAFRARPCPVGSKKSSATSTFTYHLARSRPRRSHFHHTRTGRTDGSFVLKKAHHSWMRDCLVPQNASSGGLCGWGSEQKNVSTTVGSHSRSLSCRSLLHRFLGSISSSDPRREQHTAVGKETGETAHVERWNNTLRQRLARFIRMTLSFSKSGVMHEACLLLFLHRYNLDRAILLT